MKKLISIFIVVVLSVFLNVGYASASVELPMIYGYVFDNVVRDGDLNSGEFPIGGVTITLSGPKFSTTTSSSVHGSINGTFSFIVYTPGIYYLTETNPYGYVSTSLDQIAVIVVSSTSQYYVEFSDAIAAEKAGIYGCVYDDLDENVVMEFPDTPIYGVSVSLSGPATSTTYSDIYGGMFFFLHRDSGHLLCHRDQPIKLREYHTVRGHSGGSFRHQLLLYRIRRYGSHYCP